MARLVAEGRADVTRAGGRLGPSAAVLMAALAALDGATRHLVSPTADETARRLPPAVSLRIYGSNYLVRTAFPYT
ncbi:hypothetical protein J8J27_35170, partial [Mycobacterium tuberculosis]|nr:hypothetical protein [Mycobacterium tuberculosis]